ncbi:DNA primase/helicase [Escherichia phage EJP2]|nr:DNA primase/helicase [Escherichia phage EJP2]
MVNTDVTQYSIQAQERLLAKILSNPELYVRCKNILRPEYFDNVFRNSIEFVNEYAVKYSELPPLDDINFKGGMEYKQTPVSDLHQQSVLDDISAFCRHKALALAVQKGMELVHQKKYGGIEELIREAMLVSVQNELGLDIYEDPTSVIKSLADMQGSFKSGWDTLDYKLFGGFGRQELEIFAAASGGGKSVVLQNLAVNFSKSGLNGAYISLELAKELVAVRIYGMLIDKKQQEVKTDIDNTALQVKIEEKTNGMLRIHRLPESVSTTNDIESYLRELQIKTGVKLDYVCVDYLDLLTSDRCTAQDKSNAFVKDKFVSEELRALAMKMDITVFTACQFNRDGVKGEDKKSSSQIAGGISKIYTADNVIFIDGRKDVGEMWFDFQKTRNSSAVGSRLRMSYNMDSLRVLDHAMTVEQMQQETSFQHSGKVRIGGGNVLSSPSAPTAIQQLHNSMKNVVRPLQAPTSTEEVVESTVSESTTGTNEPAYANTALNTSNTPSNGRVDNMRKFLQNRK